MSRRRTRSHLPVFDRGRCGTCLAEGIETLGVAVSETAQARLLDYIETLATWNATHNLTAVRDPEAMVVRHLLDCLAVVDWVLGPRVADVGTGAGLPGLVLATVRPDRALTLIESNHKKIAFLRHARRTLGLDNVTIVAGRVEAQTEPAGFDWVVTRAFASAAETIQQAGHLVAPGGRLGLMKAREPGEALAGLDGFVLEADHVIDVPGLEAARRLLVLVRAPA